jgi:hypothetical protein
MIFFGDFFELGDVHQFGELIEVEHVFILAVFTKESHVLAEIHVLKMICDKAAVAALECVCRIRLGFLECSPFLYSESDLVNDWTAGISACMSARHE